MQELYLVGLFVAGIGICALVLALLARLFRRQWRQALVYFGLAELPPDPALQDPDAPPETRRPGRRSRRRRAAHRVG